jgi:hypothetical protein
MAGPSCPGRTGRPALAMAAVAAYRAGMSLLPDQPLSSLKPKLSIEERWARQADRLKTFRLRMAIGQELDYRGIITPAAIGAALGMQAAEAVKLLNRHQWREGDVELLRTAAARLGLPVPKDA